MKNNVFIMLLVVSCYCSANAQSIARYVVSSAGSTIENANHQLLFTIGEPVIGTIENGTVIGQGFLASIEAEETLGNNRVLELTGITLYPNPVSDNMTLDLGAAFSEMTLQIYNSNGMEVYSQILDRQENTIPLQKLASGLYIVKIIDTSKVKAKIFKILKN